MTPRSTTPICADAPGQACAPDGDGKNWESRASRTDAGTSSDSREHAAASALTKLQEEAGQIREWARLIPAVADRIERQYGESVSHKPDTPAAVKWLVAVDVTTKDFGTGDDIAMRKRQLGALALETKGKPVAIVAQFSIADVNPQQMRKYSQIVSHPYHIERYIIADGNMKQIDAVNSGGLSADLRNSLSFASDRFRGERVAALIDSHGSGNRGLTGDTGSATVPEIVEAVKKGLKGQTLDLIDFDSCLMAQDGVMLAMSAITKDVVASAETEGGLGQDLAAPIDSLLKNPEMTASELGKTMVETARQQKEPTQATGDNPQEDTAEWLQAEIDDEPEESKKVPVKTLAHFDLRNRETFRTELDEVGKALCDAIKDPVNRRVVDKLLETCPSYGTHRDKLDVKGFIEMLVNTASTGALSDPGGNIRIHGGRLLDAHKQLVAQYSGFYEYSTGGGLTFYAPQTEQVDYNRRARGSTSACQFKVDCDNPPNLAAPAEKGAYLEKLDKELKKMTAEIVDGSGNAPQAQLADTKLKIKEAQDSVAALHAAHSETDTFAALTAMRKSAQELENTDFYKDIIAKHEQKARKEVAAVYKSELVKPGSGWGDFIEALRR